MTIGRYIIKKAGQYARLFFEVSNLLCSRDRWSRKAPDSNQQLAFLPIHN
jgi:hypothetical protein